MPETFSPVTLANGSGVALDADYFNRLETAMESMDDRGVALERGVDAPVAVTYSATITPDAGAGSLFRCTATGDLVLSDPINGTDGQTIVLEILASGSDRVLSFSGDAATAVRIAAGQCWRGALSYRAASNTWLLND